MKNNDILRRIRYIFDYSDNTMQKIFSLADYKVNRAEISNWLKKDSDADFTSCNDQQLALFLNGMINKNRGKKEGAQPEIEKKLNNNIVLRKLKIALNFKNEEMLATLQLADYPLSKSELSAFFRKPSHKNYRLCKDQVLRNFLLGMQVKFKHPKTQTPSAPNSIYKSK